MTRENAAKLWPIIKAYGEGAKVEIFSGGVWMALGASHPFICNPEIYRIAPREFWIASGYAFKEKEGAEAACSVGRIIHVQEVI